MKRTILMVLLVLFGAAAAQAQTPPVKNPRGVQFTSVDHNNASTTGYELDIKAEATGTVIQTLAVTKANTIVLPNGDIQINVNVQPIAFGDYRFVARTVAGTIKSADSVPSDVWTRAPGAPGKPVVLP